MADVIAKVGDGLWNARAHGLGGLVGARPGLRDLRHRPGVGAARARRARAGRRRPAARWPARPGLGAASSSCSYAAIAIAKSLFQKGASAASALAFQFASTNLVWELGLVLWVLIGWQFTLAEYLGGLVMIALMWAAAARSSSRAATRPPRASTPRAPTPATSTTRPAASCRWRERLTSAAGVVGRRPQLPRRLADAVEGDPPRLPARRLHRAAGRRLLQRPLPRRRAGRPCRPSGARSSARSSPC